MSQKHRTLKAARKAQQHTLMVTMRARHEDRREAERKQKAAAWGLKQKRTSEEAK